MTHEPTLLADKITSEWQPTALSDIIGACVVALSSWTVCH